MRFKKVAKNARNVFRDLLKNTVADEGYNGTVVRSAVVSSSQ